MATAYTSIGRYMSTKAANEIYNSQNGSDNQTPAKKQSFIFRCKPDTIGYADKLERLIQNGHKDLCLEEFQSYIKAIPSHYSELWYKDRVSIAIQVLKYVDDPDFNRAATEALNYILLDNFHENIKFGENHLANRIEFASTLFHISIMAVGEGIGEKAQKTIRDIGAKAYFEYAMDADMSHKERAHFATALSKYKGYKDMCLEASKAIIQSMDTFDYNILHFSDYYTNFRETDNVISFAYVLGSIAQDTSICIEWRKWAYKNLVSYRDSSIKDSNLFNACHKNKICIKEITDSLECLDHWINDLSQLVDYPAISGDSIH